MLIRKAIASVNTQRETLMRLVAEGFVLFVDQKELTFPDPK